MLLKRSLLLLVAALTGLALVAGCSGGGPAATGAQIPAHPLSGAHYPVSFDAASATVLAGEPTAPTTVDTYEDFLCPYCGRYERDNADRLESALESGRIRIRYHLLNLLDRGSTPAGYSTLAANAALLVAKSKPSGFPAFHASLYATQPEEGQAGYTVAQLADLAHRLGVTDPDFARELTARPFARQVSANLTAAENTPKLQRHDGDQVVFGTPAVLVNGNLADPSDANWLPAAK